MIPADSIAAVLEPASPLPPEMNTTPNPPTGAIFDYLLPKAPAGPVVLEVRETLPGAVDEAINSWLDHLLEGADER